MVGPMLCRIIETKVDTCTFFLDRKAWPLENIRLRKGTPKVIVMNDDNNIDIYCLKRFTCYDAGNHCMYWYSRVLKQILSVFARSHQGLTHTQYRHRVISRSIIDISELPRMMTSCFRHFFCPFGLHKLPAVGRSLLAVQVFTTSYMSALYTSYTKHLSLQVFKNRVSDIFPCFRKYFVGYPHSMTKRIALS